MRDHNAADKPADDSNQNADHHRREDPKAEVIDELCGDNAGKRNNRAMEMSIPPVSRTIVMPTAQIPVMETCRQMFSRFFVDKNVFVRTEKKTNTNRSTR